MNLAAVVVVDGPVRTRNAVDLGLCVEGLVRALRGRKDADISVTLLNTVELVKEVLVVTRSGLRISKLKVLLTKRVKVDSHSS
jgi:hypothetical protein